MKNRFRLPIFALLALAAAACNNDDGPDYEVRVLTFEDSDYKGSDNGRLGFHNWSSLIDAQYNGELLYPQEESNWIYNWNDENNTFLASQFADNYGDRQFWGGGHAVSNYVDANLANGDYLHQLAIPVAGGHSGSNFCVHNGTNDDVTKQPSFYFMDGRERIVDHMWVTNTTYALNVMKNGGYGIEPFGADNYLKIIATGLSAAGTATGTCEFLLAQGANIVDGWTKWNLSSLGKVAAVAFTMEGNQNNSYGLATPTYFAYDDVTVRFE